MPSPFRARTCLPAPGNGGFSPAEGKDHPPVKPVFGSTRQPGTARWGLPSQEHLLPSRLQHLQQGSHHSSALGLLQAGRDRPRPPPAAFHYLPHYSIQGEAPAFLPTGQNPLAGRGVPARLRVGGRGKRGSVPTYLPLVLLGKLPSPDYGSQHSSEQPFRTERRFAVS